MSSTQVRNDALGLRCGVQCCDYRCSIESMPSDLSRLFPRKRDLIKKTKRRGKPTRKGEPPLADVFLADAIVLFGRSACHVQDLFVKSIRFDSTTEPSSPASAEVEVFRAYKEGTGSIRFEPSNITCQFLLPERILHLSNLYMTDSFGLRLVLRNGHFLIDRAETGREPLVLSDYFGRTVDLQVTAR